MIPKTAPEAPILMVPRPVPFQTDIDPVTKDPMIPLIKYILRKAREPIRSSKGTPIRIRISIFINRCIGPPCMNMALIRVNSPNSGDSRYIDLNPSSTSASMPDCGENRSMIAHTANIAKLMNTSDCDTMNSLRMQ